MAERHFDEQMQVLNSEFLKMAAMVEDSIQKSIEALKKQDVDLARAVIDNDRKIDELELDIEAHTIDMLALHQPLARDLRFILTTGIKLNAELERIADLSVNICQRVLELTGAPLLKPLIDIPKLSELSKEMVKNAIDAFVKRDENLAKEVILSDTQADKLRNLVQEELVNDYMRKDGSCAPRAVPLLLIARHLERICDHASYIATDVIYMIKARNVKHHLEKLKDNPNNGK